MDKYEKIRINSWTRKFSLNINNKEWKKNRNLHAIYLLNMLRNNRVEEPYSRLPPDGPLPSLSESLVKSQLNKNYFKLAKKNGQKSIYSEFNERNSKSKRKKAKTPNIKYRNFSNMNYHKNLNNFNKKHFIIRNNNNKDKIISFHKTDSDYFQFYINNDNSNNYENTKANMNCFNNKNDNNNELIILKDRILKLEEELQKKEKIIEYQREKKVKLTLKVDELEHIFDSLKSKKINNL